MCARTNTKNYLGTVERMRNAPKLNFAVDLGRIHTGNTRRVAKVSIGVFVEPQILLSAGGALTRGVRGMLPLEIFENLSSQKPHFLHFETHFRQITTLFYSSFLSHIHHSAPVKFW